MDKIGAKSIAGIITYALERGIYKRQTMNFGTEVTSPEIPKENEVIVV